MEEFNLDKTLADAYHMASVRGIKPMGVQIIRKAITEHPEIVPILRDRLAHMQAVIKARSLVGDERGACHVTAVLADLLRACVVSSSP